MEALGVLKFVGHIGKLKGPKTVRALKLSRFDGFKTLKYFFVWGGTGLWMFNS